MLVLLLIHLAKTFLKKLNINKEEYKKIFNNIANNWRFCMTEKIKNVGTMVLKQLREQAPIEWEKNMEINLNI